MVVGCYTRFKAFRCFFLLVRPCQVRAWLYFFTSRCNVGVRLKPSHIKRLVSHYDIWPPGWLAARLSALFSPSWPTIQEGLSSLLSLLHPSQPASWPTIRLCRPGQKYHQTAEQSWELFKYTFYIDCMATDIKSCQSRAIFWSIVFGVTTWVRSVF